MKLTERLSDGRGKKTGEIQRPTVSTIDVPLDLKMRLHGLVIDAIDVTVRSAKATPKSCATACDRR